jgi:hypothetical protein
MKHWIPMPKVLGSLHGQPNAMGVHCLLSYRFSLLTFIFSITHLKHVESCPEDASALEVNFFNFIRQVKLQIYFGMIF